MWLRTLLSFSVLCAVLLQCLLFADGLMSFVFENRVIG